MLSSNLTGVLLVLGLILAGLAVALVRARRSDVSRRAQVDDATALLRSTQDHVREQDIRLAAIIESAMDAIITIDKNQNIVLFNAAAERIFELSATQAIGQPLAMLLPERLRGVHAGHVKRFGETGVTTRRMGARQTLVGLRVGGPHAGAEFPIEASISQTSEGGAQLYTVILRDISERVQTEAEIEHAHRELRRLSKAANEALEAERRRVARELHDELGQRLTALKMDVSDARGLVPSSDVSLAARLDRMQDHLDQTVASTRRISSDLRPLVLDDLGLEAALEWLTRGFEQRTGVATTLMVDPAMANIGEPHASAIFRIVQESLTNVARHAQATYVEVHVRADDAMAHVEVRDNGRGLAPGDTQKPGSHGLLGIRERARLLGGRASIDNHAHGGAVVSARLPLAPIGDLEGATT